MTIIKAILTKKLPSPIRIGNHAWIGMNVTIVKDVLTGAGAVITAGAMVNKDVFPNTLAASVAASVKRSNVQWENRVAFNEFLLFQLY